MFSGANTQASSQDNIFGWAWSENFGWVSFNCTNYFTCGTSDYGVNVNRVSGHFEGYAWSDNLGWISFEENDSPPDNSSFSSNCIQACSPTENCTACYSYSTDNIYGWAKIISMGDDGWIKFNHGGGTGEGDLRANDATGDFFGYGWNGNTTDADADTIETGMGWLSFNCANNNVCDTSRYLVNGDFVNNVPEVENMSAPNWSNSRTEGCFFGSRYAFLQWDFADRDAGACQLAYRIIVDDDNSRVDDTPLLDTGKCEGSYDADNGVCSSSFSSDSLCQSSVTANRYNLREGLAHNNDSLEYNKAYYWWIKVWDERGLESEWFQYGTTPDTHNDDGNSLTFTTYKHKFPNVSFSWFPIEPSIGEDVDFTDTTLVYSDASPDVGAVCAGPTDCGWSWTFEQADIDASSGQNPEGVEFLQGGSMEVELTVTDSDNYSCTNSANIENVSVCLPLWQERAP